MREAISEFHDSSSRPGTFDFSGFIFCFNGVSLITIGIFTQLLKSITHLLIATRTIVFAVMF